MQKRVDNKQVSFIFSIILILLVLSISQVFALVGHTASQITGGALGSGNYTYSDSIFVMNNIGVNTTLPHAALDVNGTAVVNKFYTAGNNTRNTGDAQAADIVIGSSAVGGIRHNGNIMFWTLAGAGNILADDSSGARTLHLQEWSSSSDGVTLPFNAGGTSYFSGNVGIGTTNPGVKLTTQGTNGAPATSGSAQTFGGFRIENQANNYVLDFGINGGNPWLQSYTDKTNLATYSGILLNPNGGNVGIGTTSPSQKLDVFDGNNHVTIGEGGNGAIIRLNSTGNYVQQISFASNSVDGVKLRGSGYGLAIQGVAPYLNIGYADAAYNVPLVVNGTVAINRTTAVSGYILAVNGQICETDTSLSACSSDARLKYNIKPIASGLDIIMKLKPKTFSFSPDGQIQGGLIAQDLQVSNPDWVVYKDDGYMTYNDHDFIKFSTVRAIQELKQENDVLKSELCKKDPTYSFCKKK